MKRIWGKVWPVLKDTFSEWSNDKCARLGAALSYYTVFSLAPVLILVIAVAGVFLGREAAQGEIVKELGKILGLDAAKMVQAAILKSSQSDGGISASVLGIVTLLVGATGVMVELQDALNTVWKVIPKPGASVKRFLRARLLALAIVLTLGFLLLVSLVMSAGLELFVNWTGSYLPKWIALGYILNYVVSIGFIALFFALLFKLLPDAKVAWKDVWFGALITSLLFHLGKYLIALYIGRASVASTFGAAGSLAVLLVWIYYSSQILLLGAEATRAYANRYGSRVVPNENAIPAPTAAPDRLAVEKAVKNADKETKEAAREASRPGRPSPSRA
jgi:membrane protein